MNPNKLNIINNIEKVLSILLFILLIVFSGGSYYYSTQMEKQIYEQEVLIQRLQYRDSISSQFFSINSSDSIMTYSYVQRHGRKLSYDELAQELYKTEAERDSIEFQIGLRDSLLHNLQHRFSFEYEFKNEDKTWVTIVHSQTIEYKNE